MKTIVANASECVQCPGIQKQIEPDDRLEEIEKNA